MGLDHLILQAHVFLHGEAGEPQETLPLRRCSPDLESSLLSDLGWGYRHELIEHRALPGVLAVDEE
jgi:hypothetical protein